MTHISHKTSTLDSKTGQFKIVTISTLNKSKDVWEDFTWDYPDRKGRQVKKRFTKKAADMEGFFLMLLLLILSTPYTSETIAPKSVTLWSRKKQILRQKIIGSNLYACTCMLAGLERATVKILMLWRIQPYSNNWQYRCKKKPLMKILMHTTTGKSSIP